MEYIKQKPEEPKPMDGKRILTMYTIANSVLLAAMIVCISLIPFGSIGTSLVRAAGSMSMTFAIFSLLTYMRTTRKTDTRIPPALSAACSAITLLMLAAAIYLLSW